MKTKLFTGTCTALVTPFSEGRINYPMLQKLLTRQIDAGIRTIVLAPPEKRPHYQMTKRQNSSTEQNPLLEAAA